MADDTLGQQALRRRILGWSFACPLTPDGDLGRDLALTPGPAGGDLARVADMDNLGQSLEIALTTLAGSDIFNLAFGFEGLAAIAEETGSAMIRERLRVAVIRVLQADPRVRRVSDVRLEDAFGAAAAGRQLGVRVDFETASGEQQLIDLGGVVPNV
jgi:phage baseplate assembly protein W